MKVKVRRRVPAMDKPAHRKTAQEAWEEFKKHYMPVELTPSPGGKECLGNGHWPGYGCQCPDCDFYEQCFPDWEGHKSE